jgi:hypothetical protein
MPLVKIPAIKAPTVSLCIRITDEKGCQALTLNLIDAINAVASFTSALQ